MALGGVQIGLIGASPETTKWEVRAKGMEDDGADVKHAMRLRNLHRATFSVMCIATRCQTAMGSLASLVFIVCLVMWDRISRRNQGLKSFVQLYATRLVLCLAGGIWIAVQLLWNSTLWVPGRSYFDGLPISTLETMCKVYLLVGNGFSMPVFLLICLVLFHTALGSKPRTNTQIIVQSLLFATPMMVSTSLLAWSEEIFGGSAREFESRGIWLHVYQYGDSYTCADQEPCIFCAYPLAHIISLAGFVAFLLLLLGLSSRKMGSLTLNCFMSLRLKILQVLLFLAVPGSVALMGVITGLRPGALASQIIAVVLIALISCIVVGSSWIMAVEPEREAWIAAGVSAHGLDRGSAFCHQSDSNRHVKDNASLIGK